MCCKIFSIFIVLVSTPFVLATMTLQLGGSLEFGPSWQYNYHIKELSSTREPETNFKAIDKEILAKAQEYFGPKIINIIKTNEANPDVVKISEAHFYDKNNNTKQEQGENDRETIRQELVKLNEQYVSNLDEYNARPAKTNKHIFKEHNVSPKTLNDVHMSSSENINDEHTGAPNRPTTVKNKRKLVTTTESTIEVSEEYTDPPRHRQTFLEPHKSKKRKHSRPRKVESEKGGHFFFEDKGSENTKRVTVEEFPGIRTAFNSVTHNDINVQAERFVKDDPRIKEFTKHVYEQSIKVFENIKDKMSNYEMKREADKLMRSYEEKFGDFVRETQNQKIKTRQGSQKVILNTLDTSNLILDRLVNYLIGKMDKKGVLRNSGVENVLLNELNKKKELENKHICSKLSICRSNESFISFVIDLLTIILNSSDKMIIEIRDAVTEVLKNTNFSGAMDPATEKRFKKGIGDIETYEVNTLRPLFAILKNTLSSRNKPIQVFGPEDSRVNKTLSFLEILDAWDKKLPPNEQNILTWNDLRNSFKEWSEGKRSDIVELVQSFTDHVLKTNNNISRSDANYFDRNINTILGY